MTTQVKHEESVPIEAFFKMMRGKSFESVKDPEKYLASLVNRPSDEKPKEEPTVSQTAPTKRG